MKRLISVLLLFMLPITAALSAASVSAADAFTLTVESAAADLIDGDIVSVPIKITGNPGYTYGKVTVEWDSDALSLCDVDYTKLAPERSDSDAVANSGSYTVVFGDKSASDVYQGDGTAFTLYFQITSAAASGDYSVILSDAEIFGEPGELSCSLNDGYIALTAAAHTHSLIYHEGKAADCKHDGVEDYWVCSDCGLLFSDPDGCYEIVEPIAIPAGHDWDDGVVVKAATCTSSGKVQYTCQHNAKHTRTEKIDPLGHSLTYVPAKAATASKKGHKAYYKCDRCGAWFRDRSGTSEITDHSKVVIPALKAESTTAPTTAPKKSSKTKRLTGTKANLPAKSLNGTEPDATSSPTELPLIRPHSQVTPNNTAGSSQRSDNTGSFFLWFMLATIAVAGVACAVIYFIKKRNPLVKINN